MIVSLTLLFTMQAITLGSFFSEKHHRFQLSMSFLLSAVYFIIILLFLPLFATVTERLRVAFPSVHSKIKTKVNMGFAVFMLIILVRYLIYLCLQFKFFTFILLAEHVTQIWWLTGLRTHLWCRWHTNVICSLFNTFYRKRVTKLILRTLIFKNFSIVLLFWVWLNIYSAMRSYRSKNGLCPYLSIMLVT